MSRIDNLDKVLDYVCTFSRNLASIPTMDLSMNTGIEIDELTEYLNELENRSYINNYNNGSYITLKGRIALENSKNGKPFKEEVEDKRLNRYWSITKIIAGVLNSIAIIGIAIWVQVSSNENSKLENDIESLKREHKTEKVEQIRQIDSLNNVLKELKTDNLIMTNAKKEKNPNFKWN
ncbi:hypothetical protein LS482_17305 [Sinomicrobium kalidii]|uniref:hypothetical protein n=1 Tax=Sinomicrobium kalidii TaxID=2900738 RepID=UPI001E52A528|nr:hypothetical protein [Sinomicrobium kalidii]UGU15427.1 hypothetical protein LS482_17305 [Sinomicrobium kalidii]